MLYQLSYALVPTQGSTLRRGSGHLQGRVPLVEIALEMELCGSNLAESYASRST